MSLNEWFNGFQRVFQEREDHILSAIAEEYDLKFEDLIACAERASSGQKIKAAKPQKRQPKKAGPLKGKERSKSAYQHYVKDHRDIAKDLLKNNPEERTFVDKEGKEVEIDPDEFKNGEPVFSHITKKVAAMWRDADDQTKKKYQAKAQKEKEHLEKERLLATSEGTEEGSSESESDAEISPPPKTKAKTTPAAKKTPHPKAPKKKVEDEDSSLDSSEEAIEIPKKKIPPTKSAMLKSKPKKR